MTPSRTLFVLSVLLSMGLLACHKKPNPQPLTGVVLPVDPKDRMKDLPDTASTQEASDALMADLADWRNYGLTLRKMFIKLGATPPPAAPQAPPSQTPTQPSNPNQ